MAAAGAEGAGFGAKFQAATAGLGSFMLRLGLLGAAVTAFGLTTAVHFDSAATHIQAMTSATAAQVAHLKTEAIGLSNAYGESATQIVKSSYDVFSARDLPFQAFKVVAAGAKGAAASQQDLTTTMKALTTTLVDYPHRFKSANDAMGEITKTVQLGRMQMDEYARSISTVEPIASKLGITYSQLGAMIAQMTRHGVTAQNATQNVRNAMLQMITPTLQARMAARALGLDWQTLYHSHGNNLLATLHALFEASKRHVGSLEAIHQATGYTNLRLSRFAETLHNQNSLLKLLTGTTLGFNVAQQTLAGQGYAQTIRMQGEISNGAQAMNDAWNTVKENAGTQIKILKENITNLSMAIGQAMLPALLDVTNAITPLAEHLAILAQHHTTLTALIFGTSAAFLALGISLHLANFGITLVTGAWKNLNDALDMVGRITGLTEATKLEADASSASATKTDILTGAKARLKVAQLAESDSLTGMAAKRAIDNGLMEKQKVAEETLLAARQRTSTANAAYDAALQRHGTILTEVGAKETALAVKQDEYAAAQMREGIVAQEVNAEIARQGVLYGRLTESISIETAAQARYDELLAQSAATTKMTAAMENNLAMAKEAVVFANDEVAASERALAVQTEISRAKTTELATAQNLVRDSSLAEAAANVELRNSQAEIAVTGEAVTVASEGVAVAEGESALATTAYAAANVALMGTLSPLLAILGAIAAALGITVATMLIIVAVIAVVAIGFYELYEHCKPFHDIINLIAQTIATKVMDAFRALGDLFESLWQKVMDLWNALGPFQDIIIAITAIIGGPFTLVIGAIIILMRHWGEITSWVGDKIKGLGHNVGQLGNWLQNTVPGVKGLADANKNLNDALAATGSRMDGTSSKGKELAGVQHLAANASVAFAHKINESSTALKQHETIVMQASAAYKKMAENVKISIATLKQQAAQDFADMTQHAGHTFDAMTNHAINSAKLLRAGVISELNGLAGDMVTRVKLPPIKLAVATPEMNKKMAGSDVHDNVNAIQGSSSSLEKGMSALADIVGKLPPEFDKAGQNIVDGYRKKVDQLNSDFMAKLKSENDRYATAVNAARHTALEQVKAANAAAVSAQKNENDSYNRKLDQIQQAHDSRVSTFLSNMLAAWQSMFGHFQSQEASQQAKRDQSNATYNQQLATFHQHYLTLLDQHQSKYDAQYRQRITEQYNNEKAAAQKNHDLELANIAKKASVDAKNFADAANKQKQRDDHWSASESARFASQQAKANADHVRRHAQIQKTLDDADKKAKQTLHDHEVALLHAHQRHVADLERVFNEHAKKLGDKLGATVAPGGLWDSLKKSADDLANGSMKALNLAELEGAGNIKKLVANVVQAQAAQIKLTAAEEKAQVALVKAQLAAGNFETALATITNKTDNDYKKALDAVIADHYAGHEASTKHLKDLHDAIEAQKKLTAAQDAAGKDAVALGAKGKKTADEWVTALNTAKTAVDSTLSGLVAHQTLAYLGLAPAVKDYQAKLNAATVAQARFTQATDKAAADQAKSEIAAAKSVGNLASEFDKTKSLVSGQLNTALSKAAQELMDNGKVSEGTRQCLLNLQKQTDALANAEAQAKAISDGTYGSLDELAKAAKTAADKTAGDYVNALYQASIGNTAAANSLGKLQAEAIAAANKEYDMSTAAAKFTEQLNLATLATRSDYNSVTMHAKAVYEDALAAYENAVTMHASSDELERLKQAAIDAGVALKKLESIPAEIEKAITDIVDPGAGDPTAYQQDELGIQDQKLALQEQKQSFDENLAQNKLNLAEQKQQAADNKAANAKLTTGQGTTNELLKEANATLTASLNAALQQIALANKMMYLSRLGLSRVMVGDSIGFMNSMGGAGAMSTVSAGRYS